jgi:hypothetical protein
MSDLSPTLPTLPTLPRGQALQEVLAWHRSRLPTYKVSRKRPRAPEVAHVPVRGAPGAGAGAGSPVTSMASMDLVDLVDLDLVDLDLVEDVESETVQKGSICRLGAVEPHNGACEDAALL